MCIKLCIELNSRFYFTLIIDSFDLFQEILQNTRAHISRMQSQYNFKKVYQIVKRSIARNITIGERLNQMLNEVPHELMNRVIHIVKQQYKMDDDNDQFTSQKKNHELKTLYHILKRTYDFKTKNIMLALQLNQEYPQDKVEISPEDIPYQCSICQKRYFKQRQHLLTHEKSCVKKFNIESKEIFSQLS